MAFLDETGVQNLTAQIKTLADATYAPLSHTHPSTDISGLTDEKLSTAEVASGTYFPVLSEATSTAETKGYSLNLSFSMDSSLTALKISDVSSNAVGIRFSGLNGIGTIRATSSLTTVSTYDLPNASGTLALTSNIPSAGTTASAVGTSSSGGSATTYSKSDHIHNITSSTITSALGFTPSSTDNKVAQNNSTAANDYRVLLSSSTSDSNQTAEANKSAGLRFMPSTNHLYVGSSGEDAYISVSPRLYLGAYTRYTQDGQEESSTSYGVGLGINNALAYNSYLTTASLYFQHWNASRPSGGVPSSTNYVSSSSAVSNGHIIFEEFSGKNSLTTSAELTSTQLSFVSSGTTYTVTPTKINKWDNYTDTKNTAGSTNTSSKIFLVGATSQAANPQTYSHDTAYVGTNGHLYSNSKQVVNLSDSQTISNKTLDNSNIISSGTVVNNPAITSTTFNVAQSTWGATTSTYTTEIGDFVCRRWGPVVMLYIRFTTGATGGTGTTRTFFTPADNYKPVGLYYCQVNASGSPYAQVTNASFWFTSAGILQGRAVASTEYRISCMYLVNN